MGMIVIYSGSSNDTLWSRSQTVFWIHMGIVIVIVIVVLVVSSRYWVDRWGEAS